MSISLEQGILQFKASQRVHTRTPPWSVVAFGVMNENGQLGAYADSATGVLTIPAAQSPSGAAIAVGTQAQIVTPSSGAVAIQNSTVVITKTGSLAALTLAVPTTAQNGTRITFTSTTAFAHTVTCPSAIINRGVTGDPVTVGTLAAFPGAGFTVEAYAGKWNVISNMVTSFA